MEDHVMLRFYRTPVLGAPPDIQSEWCYYAQVSESLSDIELSRLSWLLSETFEPGNFSRQSFLSGSRMVLEIGPRLNFETAWSTTAVAICHACGLNKIIRLERSRRYGFSKQLVGTVLDNFLAANHDRMTEMQYHKPLGSFDIGLAVEPVRIIPVIEQGIGALRRINIELGLGMDEQDMQMYYHLFVNVLKRNPTDVELCQLGQSNSEHSRHGFFKGRLVIDGQEIPESLMDIIKTPWRINPGKSLVAFGDDSSAIEGGPVRILVPAVPGRSSAFILEDCVYHPILSVETHNHPTGVEPYQGAATGTGGWLRDIFAMRLGGTVIAASAGYCAGNLHIADCSHPWEEDGWQYPSNLASPLDILIQASNGASDYGNRFGVPIIYGFTRTFGIELSNSYRSWFKPIMCAGGIGQFNDKHREVYDPAKGMLVVQIGGPAYRIGIGGGSLSSMIAGQSEGELEFASVQRGDAQMEQPVYRVIRTCVELGDQNPIAKAVDLGAGGDCNALPELVVPAGAIIKLRKIQVGDSTLSVLEIWCNESQERVAFLIWPDRFDQVKEICEREGCPCSIVGQVTGDGFLILHDENDGTEPVNLPLDQVLGDLPRKTFHLERIQPELKPLELPDNLTVREALARVLRLVSVGSKRFLTTKVDRSVTGLIAQQQCVGPNQLTLSDYAVVAQSYFGLTGMATSLGEQPIKGLLSPKAMARLAVAEMLLNMVGAKITALEDIKCSANWMLAAKEPGEGAWLYEAACAVRDIMIELGIAIDGGKDSLSMAAKTKNPDGQLQVVKAPGELVITGYVTMDNITCKVTPDLKEPDNGLLFIDLANGLHRLGGSALAQVYQQIGENCPDVEDVELLKKAFTAVQSLIDKGLVTSVHDRSDGGLIVALLEMAFAGNVGININLTATSQPIECLFNEELGLVLETDQPELVSELLSKLEIPVQDIGITGRQGGSVAICMNGKEVLFEQMIDLRQIWESTSSAIDRHQANPVSIEEEAKNNYALLKPPFYRQVLEPQPIQGLDEPRQGRPKVAVLRERGSNGDREMAAAFFAAGFDVWDVTMNDLLAGQVSLDDFQGLVFPGGFSFADVLDAGKGWAGAIRFNEKLAEQFARFYQRPDTFSFGVCNGCQLMALLGWVPWAGIEPEKQPRFIRNYSQRFESRFSTVSIERSPAIMLQGMEGSQLGVWVAHGEGRLMVPEEKMLLDIIQGNLAPIRFIDGDSLPTMDYPFNPNGSSHGITALCSYDGRHLAMMPHPERAFLLWQWPWLPRDWQKLPASPWLRIFQNAYAWCTQCK